MKVDNLLLIAGQQQNVGKTTLACNIISRFSREHKIIALKITPHIHDNTGKASLVAKNENWQILEETDPDTDKDTSRMLRSGAIRSYFIQAHKNFVLQAFENMLERIPDGHLIVAESAGLREYIVPGLFLMIRQLYCKICSIEDDNLFKLADRIVTFTVNGFDFSVNEILVESDKWIIKNDDKS